jgi:hypothetical protein
MEWYMVFDVGVALTWLMFLALFPLTFVWLRRAWRIVVNRDFSEVALRRGEPPPNAGKYAPVAAAINLLCGIVGAFVIIGVASAVLDYNTWTATAGITIWGKLFADFILGRHAHPVGPGRQS